MRRNNWLFVFFLTLFMGFDNQALAAKWLKAETDNFVVYTNTNSRNAEAYITKLEQYRHILSQFYLTKEQQALPVPKIEIYLTKDIRDFNEVRPNIGEGVAGFVISTCIDGTTAFSYFSDGDNLIYRPSTAIEQVENESLIIFFHEYTHIFMAQNTTMNEPRWYTEGIAEYYSSMKFTENEFSLGHGSKMRLSQFLDGRGLIKYEDILRDSESLYQGYNALDFYAQSWLLTNYLLHDDERRRKLPLYFAAVNNGEDAVLAFERVYQIAVKDLPRILRYYLATAKTKSYSISGMPSIKVAISEMPPSANRLLLLDGAVKSCPSNEYKPRLLEKIRSESAKFPEDIYSRNVLARAEIIIGDQSRAINHFKNLSTQNPNDSEAFFRLGQAYYLMAERGNIIAGETKNSQIAKARAALARSYQINPTNPVNLYFYSRTAPKGSNFPDESSLNAAVEAHLMSPANRDYAFNAASMLVLGGELVEARSVLIDMTSKSHQTKQSKELVAAIAAIDAKKSKEEILQTLLAAALKIEEDK